MLHSALTWSKDCSPLAPPTPPSSPIATSSSSSPSSPTDHNIWCPDTVPQKTQDQSRKKERKDEEEEDVDTKRCTNITSVEEDQKLHRHHHSHSNNNNNKLNSPIITIATSLCESLRKTLSDTSALFPEDVSRALVVSVLAVTLDKKIEQQGEERLLLENTITISHELLSELLETTKVLLNWKNVSQMNSTQRLQYRRTLCALGLACGGQILNGFMNLGDEDEERTLQHTEKILRAPLLPPMNIVSSSSSLKPLDPITQRSTSRISFVQRFIAGKSSLETWLCRYVREKKISRRWGGSSAIILCRSVAAALFVRLDLLPSARAHDELVRQAAARDAGIETVIEAAAPDSSLVDVWRFALSLKKDLRMQIHIRKTRQGRSVVSESAQIETAIKRANYLRKMFQAFTDGNKSNTPSNWRSVLERLRTSKKMSSFKKSTNALRPIFRSVKDFVVAETPSLKDIERVRSFPLSYISNHSLNILRTIDTTNTTETMSSTKRCIESYPSNHAYCMSDGIGE